MKKGSLFTDILQTATKYFVAIVIVVIICILCSGICIIKSGNQAIILRFGKIVGKTYEEQVHGPGLLLAFPYIIDEVIIVPTDQVFEQSVTTHDTERKYRKTSETGYIMTGDNNIAVVSASVKYTISNPIRYALNVKDLPSIIDACVSSAMVDEASSMKVDVLLTNGQDSFTQAILQRSQEKLNKIDVGINLNSIELTKVAMPEEVRAIYERVNSATVEVSTLLGIANQYREKTLPNARSAADTIISKANSEYAKKVADANKDLAEFWGVLEEYKTDPESVKTRIYSQKVSEFMSKIGSVRIVADGDTKLFINPKVTEDTTYGKY